MRVPVSSARSLICAHLASAGMLLGMEIYYFIMQTVPPFDQECHSFHQWILVILSECTQQRQTHLHRAILLMFEGGCPASLGCFPLLAKHSTYFTHPLLDAVSRSFPILVTFPICEYPF